MIIKATYDPPSIHTASLPRLSVDGRLCRRDHGGGVGVGGGGGYTDRAGSTSKQNLASLLNLIYLIRIP